MALQTVLQVRGRGRLGYVTPDDLSCELSLLGPRCFLQLPATILTIRCHVFCTRCAGTLRAAIIPPRGTSESSCCSCRDMSVEASSGGALGSDWTLRLLGPVKVAPTQCQATVLYLPESIADRGLRLRLGVFWNLEVPAAPWSPCDGRRSEIFFRLELCNCYNVRQELPLTWEMEVENCSLHSQLKIVSSGRSWNCSFNTKLNGQTAHVPPIWESLSDADVTADLMEMPFAALECHVLVLSTDISCSCLVQVSSVAAFSAPASPCSERTQVVCAG